jgi:hypothetical protein
MDGDDADIERAVLEGGLLQHLHYCQIVSS